MTETSPSHAPVPHVTPASLGPSSEGHDPVIEAALRALDEAAAGDDAQAQVAAATHVHEVLQARLSGVGGS